MLRYWWVLPLSNEPKLIYVGPVVTEPIDFLSRTVEFWDIAHHSQAQSGERGTQIVTCQCEISSGTEPGCAARPVSFAYYIHVKNVRRNIIGQLSKKKKTIHYTITPPPTLARVCTALLQFNYRHFALTSKYSNTISYKFFIFCPICMKFSHKFLNTATASSCV